MTPYACRLFQEVFPVVSCSSQSFLLLFFFLFSLLLLSSETCSSVFERQRRGTAAVPQPSGSKQFKALRITCRPVLKYRREHGEACSRRRRQQGCESETPSRLFSSVGSFKEHVTERERLLPAYSIEVRWTFVHFGCKAVRLAWYNFVARVRHEVERLQEEDSDDAGAGAGARPSSTTGVGGAAGFGVLVLC
eukprot:s1955_g15.t1